MCDFTRNPFGDGRALNWTCDTMEQWSTHESSCTLPPMMLTGAIILAALVQLFECVCVYVCVRVCVCVYVCVWAEVYAFACVCWVCWQCSVALDLIWFFSLGSTEGETFNGLLYVTHPTLYPQPIYPVCLCAGLGDCVFVFLC